jgi:predicted membrane protein
MRESSLQSLINDPYRMARLFYFLGIISIGMLVLLYLIAVFIGNEYSLENVLYPFFFFFFFIIPIIMLIIGFFLFMNKDYMNSLTTNQKYLMAGIVVVILFILFN